MVLHSFALKSAWNGSGDIESAEVTRVVDVVNSGRTKKIFQLINEMGDKKGLRIVKTL